MPAFLNAIAEGQHRETLRRERHQAYLARIAAGPERNRTPGPALRARLGLSGSGGQTSNRNNDGSITYSQLTNNSPPERKKRKQNGVS